MTAQKAVIIGGGIGGLATAAILAKAGYKVAVYEKNDQLGGRAGLMEKDGFRFDTGPSWYLMPDVFAQYFGLFGKNIVDELDLVRLSPAYKVFFEHDDPITITSNLDHDARTFEAIEPGAGEMLKAYVTRSEIMYRLSLKHFLYSNFTSIRDLLHHDITMRAGTMTRLALTPMDRYVRSYFRDPRLKQIMEYSMVFLGTSPFSAPALYSLMSALDFKEGVFYPRGGIYTIIKRLVALGEDLGVTYHTGSEIAKIEAKNGRATGIRLRSGQVVPADIVISNADLHFTETALLEPRYQTYPARYWQRKHAGPSALLLYLGVKGTLPQLEHHNLFFVKEWRANFAAIYRHKTIPVPASLYVCKPSSTDTTVAPAGHENLFVLVPLPAGIQVDTRRAAELADSYLDQIAGAIGVADLKQRIVSKTVFGPDDFATAFYAWQSTALGPSHILGQSAFWRTRNHSKKLSNLYYVGGFTTPGIGLPMCLISAQLVYKRLAGDTAGGPPAQIDSIGATP